MRQDSYKKEAEILAKSLYTVPVKILWRNGVACVYHMRAKECLMKACDMEELVSYLQKKCYY